MDTVESIKRRIHTAEDLHSVVRTMKALAAVNIRQLEQAVESLADYDRTIELGLRVVIRQQGHEAVSSRAAPQRSLGAIVFGSDQGMCGPLNDQIVAHVLQQFREDHDPSRQRHVLTVGARAAARLQDAGQAVEVALPIASSLNGITPLVQDVLLQIEEWHVNSLADRIDVFFCEHLSRAAYRVRSLNLLPIDRTWLTELGEREWPTNVLPAFTMSPENLFSSLVRQYLFVSLYRACAESMASENASRLAAMRGAERNIGDRITEFRSQFHQRRQMTITEELLDIASGFVALADDEE